MAAGTDQSIHDLLAGLVTLLVVVYLLFLLLRGLGARRPELSIALPIFAALTVRVLAAAAVSLTGIGFELRGGDETGFLAQAQAISDGSAVSGSWVSVLVDELFKFVLAAQMFLLDSPEFALRIGQAGIAVAGLTLLAAAVYELAGARAALIVGWCLALEPTNVFFSTLLHKEPNMILASGLVAFGGANMWRRGGLHALLPIVVGCLVAVTTRPYAGWFLIATGAAMTLHAGLRSKTRGSLRAMVMIALVVLVGAVSAPIVWEASTDESLQENLQVSQDGNAADEDAGLRLEQVDFSTRGAVVTNLPTRLKDVVFRPYPWQLANAEQQFGLLGTAVAMVLLLLLARELLRNRGRIMDYAGPLVYLAFFLLVAYSLSAGNAGTGFRYRTHVMAITICLVVVLWARRVEVRASDDCDDARAAPSSRSLLPATAKKLARPSRGDAAGATRAARRRAG